jgi:hypothetical protein
MRATSRFIAVSALALACQETFAVRVDYQLETGLVHSDNIALTATDPTSQSVLVPHLDFSIREDGSSVLAEVSGVLEYRDYLGGAFGDEFRGTLNGLVNWSLIPQRLNWTFADNLGLYPVNLRNPDVPGNLQQTNVFTTGPTLRFRLSPSLQAQAELRYIDSYAEETGAFDSSRYSTALRTLYDLAPTRRVSANVEYQNIDFNNNLLAEDYRRISAFAGYTQTLAQIDLNAALGYSRLNFDHSDSVSGPLARASIDWRATDRSTFGIGMAWQYTDAATAISEGAAAFDAGFGGVTISGAAITPEVYRERRINGSYVLQGTRLNFASTLGYGTFRYEQAVAALANDRDEVTAGLNLGYLLRPRLTLGFTAEATRRRFNESGLTDRNYRYGTYLSQQMTRHLRWRVDLARNERHADAGAESYDENSIYLRLVYSR